MDQYRDELLVLAASRARTRSRTCACARRCTRRSTSRRSSASTMRGLSIPTGTDDRAAASTAATKELDKRLPVRPRRREEAAGRGRLPATASSSRSTARTTATSTTRRSARRWPRCGRSVGVKAKLNAMPLATYFPKIQKLRHQRLHARLGRARRSTRCTRCSRWCARKTTRRATATSTSAAISNAKRRRLIDAIKVATDAASAQRS